MVDVDSHSMKVEDFVLGMDTDLNKGLSTELAEQRLNKYGKNKFTPPKKENIISQIIDNLKEPMIFILLFCGVLSLFLGGKWYDTIGIFIAVLIATTIAIIQEGRAANTFEMLIKLSSNIKVKVLRDDKVIQLHKEEITIGDVIFLETGDKVPADGRIVQSLDFMTNESMLTGEAESVSKIVDAVPEKSGIAEMKNMVFGGTLVVNGRATVVITAIGDNTEMGKIAESLGDTLGTSTPLQEKLTKLGGQISIVGTALAGVVFLMQLYFLYINHNLTYATVENAFIVSVALIVAAVPEGLPTMVALTLAFNMQKMAQRQALVRKMLACETVGSINFICSDKTGTLTQNKMTVTDVYYNGERVDPDKVDSIPMLNNFCINSTADLSGDDGFTVIGNPTEGALLICAKTMGLNHTETRKAVSVKAAYNFTSYRKMMSTIVEHPSGYRIYTKGSPEKVLGLCTQAIMHGKLVGLSPEIKSNAEKQIKVLQDQAKRVILFAYKDITYDPTNVDPETVETELIFVGFVGIEDPIRHDVKAAIAKCNAAGIHVKILTGDNVNTATAIAQQLDIIHKDSLIMEAHQIEDMDDDELGLIIDKVVVIARSTPALKLRIVKLLKERRNSVAVTGDGVNDAPALKHADVGIAMGIAGTEVAKEASDIVLLDDSFATIAKSVESGRGIYENFQRFIQFQLTVNVVAFGAAMLAEMLAFGLPFTTLQLLWVNIIMDGPPALTLGLEPIRDDLMSRQPIPRNASIITKDMLFRIISNGAFIIGALLLLMKTHLLGGTLAQQSTIVFSVFVLFQLWNAFNCREFGTSSVITNWFKNKTMVGVVAVTFLIQILIVQFAGAIFHTVPLEPTIWASIVIYTCSVIVFNELIKVIQIAVKSISGNPVNKPDKTTH